MVPGVEPAATPAPRASGGRRCGLADLAVRARERWDGIDLVAPAIGRGARVEQAAFAIGDREVALAIRTRERSPIGGDQVRVDRLQPLAIRGGGVEAEVRLIAPGDL